MAIKKLPCDLVVDGTITASNIIINDGETSSQVATAASSVSRAEINKVTDPETGVVTSETIDFYNGEGTVISSIDAADFIKDGMLDSVYYDTESGNLKFVFNTEAGKEVIEVPLKLIIIDNLVVSLSEDYQTSTLVNDELRLQPGDLYETAFSKLEKAVLDNELVEAAALNDLNVRKVDAEEGKGLSTNDYTTTEKEKLAGIAEGAQVNVLSDWNATEGDALILNKPDLAVYATTNDVNTALGNIDSDITDLEERVTALESRDYSAEYLTFEALEDTTFTFSTNDLQYSLDNGTTWTTLTAGTSTDTIAAGNKIMWRLTGLTPTGSAGIGTFSATGNFKAYGNVMSLLFGDDFEGQTNLLGKSYAFYILFNNNTKLKDASNLILPATILAQDCYENMFRNCTSLTTAPELSATTLANYCYQGMFYGCTSLTTAPELSATTLAKNCYSNMFQGCESLTKAPELPATTLLTLGCYYQMFRGCTSLTIAPELPATTLAYRCYQLMFADCISLTTAPELPAITLIKECYELMFYGCTALNYIKCLAIDISATDCTVDWTNNVAASGTFIAADGTAWTTGTAGIPSGWTVKYDEIKESTLDNFATTSDIANMVVGSTQPYTIWKGTQAEYEALGTYDENTIYYTYTE